MSLENCKFFKIVKNGKFLSYAILILFVF